MFEFIAWCVVLTICLAIGGFVLNILLMLLVGFGALVIAGLQSIGNLFKRGQ